MIRVLVADDSPTARALLVAILAGEEGITVVGEAGTGREAVAMAERLAPDLVTMDIHMPDLDGLQATEQIMTRSPRPIIIVSSTVKEGDVELSLEATRRGALLVLPKPPAPGTPTFASERRHLVNMVKALAGVKVVRRHGAGTGRPGTPPSSRAIRAPAAPPRATSAVRLVAIAASTGGPAALSTILAALPRDFPVPIVVVQHIADGFTTGLAHWLAGVTRLRVTVALHGEVPARGTVYIAPDGAHLGVRLSDDGTLRLFLDKGDPVGSFRPSATFLFQSAAALRDALLGVILTGMGDDGVAGLRDVYAAGGRVLAQDEATSVIHGMPREAVRAGVVHAVVALGDMAARIAELAG